MKPFVTLSNREVEDLYHYLIRNEAGSRPRTTALREKLLDATSDALDEAGIDINDVNPA